MKKHILYTALVICLFAASGTSFAENGTAQNQSMPEILIVSSSPNEIALINRVANDSDIRNIIKVRAESGRTETNLTYNISGDVIIFGTRSGLSSHVWEALSDKLRAARNRGSTIMICVEPSARNSYAPILDLQTVSTSDPRFNESLRYLNYTSERNLKNLILYLAASFCNLNVTPGEPEQRPLWGIYHPSAPKIFSNLPEYLDWYMETGRYHEGSPTVGILSTEYTDMARDGPLLDALVRSFESKNVNVIVSTYTYRDANSMEYIMLNGKAIIDAAVLISRGATLNSQNWTGGVEDLQKLNVTVLNGIRIFSTSMNLTSWENSAQGVPCSEVYQLSLAEMDGIIEPIVISVKETDPLTGVIYNRPIEYQIEWLVKRTISWMNLKKLSNHDKKIVITYYSEGGGKANVGADIDYYLNAQASIAAILKAMQERGYNVGNRTLPGEAELAHLMAEVGSNVGTWAPGELENRVKSGSVILIPEDEYLNWFSELPPDMQREVTDAWGPAPGNLMVYTNSTGKYIVIPKLEFGNILLAPEPVWGWLQDNTTLYNTGKLPPTPNLLAFYWWMRKVYHADAILSVFSLVPLMPGKQEGLSSRDWGAVLLQDMPIIHVLPMDAPAIFDKRRANMLIINFMTPVLIPSGLYGNLSELYDNIRLYMETVDDTLKNAYRDKIINQSRTVGFNYTGDSFDEFLADVTAYLDDIRKSYIPYGPHVLGRAPEGEELIQLLIAMLPPINGTATESLLREVVLNNLTPEEAQIRTTGSLNATITGYLQLAIEYTQRIRNCTSEITAILTALEGGYITPGPRGDPIRNPDALPTGRNPYPLDSRTIPTRTAWETAVKLVDSFLEDYLSKHGTYPTKVAFVLWASETMRHQGVMEAEILYLMGVKPVWDSKGRVKDVELITNLTRPRIDITVVTSGLYRDLHMDIITLIDRAVKLAAGASDTPNHVRNNSETIYLKLLGEGFSETDARRLSLLRIFSEEPGAYSPGLQEAIPASETWNNSDQLASFYLERVSSAYGENITGLKVPSIFRENLMDVTVAMFSRSSNLYGALEHPMVAAYFGGLSLAVERVSGSKPEMYINNLRSDAKIETMSQFLTRDLLTRYLNPRWIEGMMKGGYDGARYIDSFVENLWMWQVTNPELVSESTWDMVNSIYVRDSYDMGLNEFFSKSNPYARASIIARLIETVRKGYWSPSDQVKASLANEYINMVNQYGVVCCHHTCANIVLNQWIVSLSTLNSAAIEKFKHTMAAAWGENLPATDTDKPSNEGNGEHSVSDGSSRGESDAMSAATSSGTSGSAGVSQSTSASSSPTENGDVKAYEVAASTEGTSETTQMPVYALIGIIAIVGLMGAGYLLSGRRKIK